jgi:hypothetical protein
MPTKCKLAGIEEFIPIDSAPAVDSHTLVALKPVPSRKSSTNKFSNSAKSSGSSRPTVRGSIRHTRLKIGVQKVRVTSSVSHTTVDPVQTVDSNTTTDEADWVDDVAMVLDLPQEDTAVNFPKRPRLGARVTRLRVSF